MTLLTIENLSVRFPTGPAVESLNLSVGAGESIGLVGESGSGKTQTALAIMGLVDRSAEVGGSIRLGEDELVGANGKLLRRVRARRVAMIFQDPSAALNPYRRVGDQLADIVTWHELAHGRAAREKVLGLLEKTGLPDPDTQYRRYPHQLSGGMRQRVMIAAALVAEPDIIIADEPTTALDVTVQAQILSLLLELRRETGVSLLLITHDLGVIANASDRLLVMHEGRVIEEGSTEAVFAEPQHEQTARMLAAVRSPRRFAPDMRSGQRRPVLDLDNVSVRYPTRQGIFRRHSIVALQPLRLTLRPGETIAVVGESGSGKTSLARAVLGLEAPDTGTVSYLGSQLAPTLKARKHAERKHLTLVFQDPVASLNPAMRVEQIVAEPLSVQRGDLSPAERADAVRTVLARVGLDESLLARLPHQLSGGQAQRVAIARAVVNKPSVLICDEAVASLDTSVRQGILKLLADEQRRTALSVIFISHDLTVVRQLSHRVLVLYMGHVCEEADAEALFARPLHPYTRGLIDSIPAPDPSQRTHRAPVVGEVPSMMEPPTGCVFHPRCAHAVARCSAERPDLKRVGDRAVACWRAEELDLASTADPGASAHR